MEEEKVEKLRPTKKQFEILEFIQAFIDKHGYSPSYREIMAGLDYTSVSTVAAHINSLLKRGHLVKRDHSARSIEVVNKTDNNKLKTNQVMPSEEKWLVEKIEQKFKDIESSMNITRANLEELYILSASLRLLGIEGASISLNRRLTDLKKKITE